MPRPKSDEPLTKITLDLYTRDVQRLKDLHGYGYSTVVRRLVRAHLRAVDEKIKDHDNKMKEYDDAP
jgi:hypothetical protein